MTFQQLDTRALGLGLGYGIRVLQDRRKSCNLHRLELKPMNTQLVAPRGHLAMGLTLTHRGGRSGRPKRKATPSYIYPEGGGNTIAFEMLPRYKELQPLLDQVFDQGFG